MPSTDQTAQSTMNSFPNNQVSGMDYGMQGSIPVGSTDNGMSRNINTASLSNMNNYSNMYSQGMFIVSTSSIIFKIILYRSHYVFTRKPNDAKWSISIDECATRSAP
jgi:hypothetical protein